MSDVVKLSEFTSEFREWVESEGTTRFRTEPDGAAVIVYGSGEIVYSFTRIDDGWIRVSESDRGNEPAWMFEAAAVEYAEKRLALKRGIRYRQEKKMPRLYTREWRSTVAPENAIRAVDIMRDGMLRPREETLIDGEAVFSFTRDTRSDRSPAAGATWWADQPLHLIIESFKHPAGEPLFELAGDRYN